MADDKIITLRFKSENVLEMELYRELENEKNVLGLSMPVYVKGILQEHFEHKSSGKIENEILWEMKDELRQYLKEIQSMVRSELVSLNSALLKTFVRMNETNATSISDIIVSKSTEELEGNLPKISDELPDGFDDILGKFM